MQGAIKLRSMFQILNFIATGIRIAPEFEAGPNLPTEEADEGATATLKINVTDSPPDPDPANPDAASPPTLTPGRKRYVPS